MAMTQTFVIAPESTEKRLDTKSSAASSVTDELPRGTMLGHFEIQRHLGHGGMGEVYLALDTSLQRYVALKVIRREAAGEGSTSAIASLKQEAVAQARINHPNVVTVYFVGEQNGDPFIAMEYVATGTLATRLNLGPLQFQELIAITRSLMQALQVAEKSGIVHCDIKPSNILLAVDGTPKLSDFGLARIDDAEHERGVFRGTPAYLAPELFSGGARTVQSDMYSLGVSLYESSYGQLPYSVTRDEILRQKWDESRVISLPENNQEFPEVWRSFISRLLSVDPNLRFATYSEALEELDHFDPADLTTASRFTRLVGFVLDQTLMMMTIGIAIVMMLVVEMAFDLNYGVFAKLVQAAIIISITLGWSYLEALWRNSLGHYLLQLRVVDSHGTTPTFRKFFYRSLLRTGIAGLTMFPLPEWVVLAATITIVRTSFAFLFYLAQLVFVGFRQDQRCVHDMLCGTRVVVQDRPILFGIRR